MLAGIKIETLKENAAPSYLMASGKVQFNEDELANIVPPVPGQVQELKIKVGDHVQKGDALFSVYSRDVAAALAEHIETHKDLDLAEKLRGEGYLWNSGMFVFQARTMRAQCLVNTTTDLQENVAEGMAVCESALILYQILERADWQEHPDCKHAFPEAIRKQAYDFLDDALR